PMVSFGQRAANRVGRTGGLLILKKCFDRFLEAALEQMLVAVKWNQPPRLEARFLRQMEAVNRIEKKQRPHPLVEVRALMAKLLQLRGGGEQLFERSWPAKRVQRLIAHSRVWTFDDVDQV